MKGQENEHYHSLQNPEKGILHDTLLSEQGSLCGYTMKRISRTTSHIEHIKPEVVCRAEQKGLDLDYVNLIACYPKEGMKASCRYGAQEKGSWWDDNGRDFISPLLSNCESVFTFNIKGEIGCVANNLRAKKTIEVLKLDNKELTEDRRRAIDEFLYGENLNSPISKGEATRIKSEVEKRKNDGSFVEYCVTIKHALGHYIELLDKNSKQKKFASKSIRKQKRK